ncbi:gamma carbonic anhydrase family protein [Propionivibrio sp.]|uniref:gamma carbonic anhydrase family protein n=1 Tax=Propionivibrio sp. TaxID=2212460 RepID=UPI003BF35858
MRPEGWHRQPEEVLLGVRTIRRSKVVDARGRSACAKKGICAPTKLWWNVTVRGDSDLISIGENTNIQDGSVLHTDKGIQLIIGRDVTVGHMVMLHGCTIGEGSLIGIGSILLNRSVIGKNSLVGANTLIPEGKVFPDRVLIVGSPGKVIRELTDEEVAGLPGSAERYVQNWQRYQRELTGK